MTAVIEEEAAVVLDAACQVIAAGWGAERAEDFRRLVRSDNAYLEPRSFRSRIAKEAAAILSGPPPSDEALERMAAPLAQMRRLLMAPGARERTLIAGPEAGEFAVFLSAARDRIGTLPFRDMVEPLLQIGWADLVVPGMDRYLQPAADSFEHAIMVVGNGVRREAEVWYKPMLQAALRLTVRKDGRPRGEVPDELGPLLTQCREAWLGIAGLLSLVDPNIAIIRNSDAHGQTEINPDTETVVFVNRPRNKPEERLGPLTRSQVGQAVNAFTDRCLILSLVYRAVLEGAMP